VSNGDAVAASNGHEPVLVVEDIHTFYGSIEALKGISLEVNQGEIVTLIGANGAGKSTTLRSISGIVPPRMGRIVFNGAEIQGLPGHTVAEIGRTSRWGRSPAATRRASARTSTACTRCSRA
jgi:ABC-type branched-subunit amino acid transport system ATPase component